ncbi:TolC family protein [Hymenobacter actinosclerus]|uniref:Outer membrane protein TolC n=1 Tax=Hymenobacter actinosclerus TaxID=82805 RepID=A0A1I0GF41_9BACT|nr:TolC family protein [Hymenobacter actinosclerus]SET69477.1 Outer membrane protein TolC [Hymenobacter actinosclerus]
MRQGRLLLSAALALTGGALRAQHHPTSLTQSPPTDTLRLTLPEVWQRADEHSRVVTIKKQAVAVGQEEVRDAITERLPEIGVMGSAEKATNIPIYTNGLLSAPEQHEVIHTLYRVGADFYLNIYNGNKLNLKIEQERIRLRLAGVEQAQAVSDIRYLAASRYLELQQAAIFRGLLREDIRNQEKQLLEIEALHRNGVVLKSDLLRVRLELSRRKLALVTIENDLRLASQKLNQLIGEPDERTIQPAPLADPASNELHAYPAYLAEALEHSFLNQLSEQQTELSRLNVRQVQANVRPKVGMYGDFYYANPQIFLYPYNPYWYSLGIAGIRASFPISALYHNVHKEKAARLELAKEEEMHHDTQDRVRQQVNEGYLRYQEALVRIGVAEVNVAQARENGRIVKNTYFHQTALITDLLDADVQVLQTQFELAAARIQAQNKYYRLQNVVGTL